LQTSFVAFCKLAYRIKLKHFFNSADENCKVLLLVATIVERLNGEMYRGQFNRSEPFRGQRLSERVQRLTTLVSALA
jgi:hypothetical protein